MIIPQELNAPIKVWKFLYLFDLFFIISYFAVSAVFAGFVHSSLQIPYYIFTALMAVLLTLRSPYNPQKRIFQTVIFAIKKDRTVYHPISLPKDDAVSMK